MHIMCKTDAGIVMQNFAALHAEVFTLSTKNLRGGGGYPTPVDARVKAITLTFDLIFSSFGLLFLRC